MSLEEGVCIETAGGMVGWRRTADRLENVSNPARMLESIVVPDSRTSGWGAVEIMARVDDGGELGSMEARMATGSVGGCSASTIARVWVDGGLDTMLGSRSRSD